MCLFIWICLIIQNVCHTKHFPTGINTYFILGIKRKEIGDDLLDKTEDKYIIYKVSDRTTVFACKWA